jgi:hypothetical protein
VPVAGVDSVAGSITVNQWGSKAVVCQLMWPDEDMDVRIPSAEERSRCVCVGGGHARGLTLAHHHHHLTTRTQAVRAWQQC